MEKFCSNQPLAKIPGKSYGASHRDQMSPLQLLFKIPQGVITLRVLAHTCGPADVRRHNWAMTRNCKGRMRPFQQNAPPPSARSLDSTALELFTMLTVFPKCPSTPTATKKCPDSVKPLKRSYVIILSPCRQIKRANSSYFLCWITENFKAM